MHNRRSMRRLWLLALLAPALASAQDAPAPAVGQITWPTVVRSNTDGYINLEECVSGNIEINWLTSTTSVTSYALYASDRAPTGDECFTTDTTVDGNAIKAGQVGNDVTSDLTNRRRVFATNEFVARAGKTCSGTGTENIFLCIQARSGGTNVGVARLGLDNQPAKLILSRSVPPAPEGITARAGEQAANVEWSEGPDNGTASDSYEVAAWIGSTIVARSGRIGTTEHRLGGLTNDQPYGISVVAFSIAGNPSGDPVVATSVTPGHVLDFWDAYRNLGGRETGGCAGGPAGPVALLATAAALALALARRKK